MCRYGARRREGAGVSSLVELWAVLGMRRAADSEDEAALIHIEQFLLYVQANEPPAESSEGPALPPVALEQLASIGAQSSGGSAVVRQRGRSTKAFLHCQHPAGWTAPCVTTASDASPAEWPCLRIFAV